MNSNPSTDASNAGGPTSASEAGQPATQEVFEELPKATQVIYEDPSVQKKREEMIRKMGGSVDKSSEAGTIKSIGVVKDVGSEERGGVGGRVKRNVRGVNA